MNIAEAKSILGIEGGGLPTKKQVNAAYRASMKLNHPDRFVGDEEKREHAERQSRLINEARAVLLRVCVEDDGGEAAAGGEAHWAQAAANTSRPPRDQGGYEAWREWHYRTRQGASEAGGNPSRGYDRAAYWEAPRNADGGPADGAASNAASAADPSSDSGSSSGPAGSPESSSGAAGSATSSDASGSSGPSGTSASAGGSGSSGGKGSGREGIGCTTLAIVFILVIPLAIAFYSIIGSAAAPSSGTSSASASAVVAVDESESSEAGSSASASSAGEYVMKDADLGCTAAFPKKPALVKSAVAVDFYSAGEIPVTSAYAFADIRFTGLYVSEVDIYSTFASMGEREQDDFLGDAIMDLVRRYRDGVTGDLDPKEKGATLKYDYSQGVYRVWLVEPFAYRPEGASKASDVSCYAEVAVAEGKLYALFGAREDESAARSALDSFVIER